MTRIRKAWRVEVDGYDHHTIVHAPTASRAKGTTLLDLTEVGWEAGPAFRAMRVRRSPGHDLHLPDEHRLVADLSPQERAIVMHAYGANSRSHGHRNHFCTDPGNLTLLRLAWEFGLFSGPRGETAYGETPNWAGAFFFLTDLGKAVALSMVPTYARA